MSKALEAKLADLSGDEPGVVLRVHEGAEGPFVVLRKNQVTRLLGRSAHQLDEVYLTTPQLKRRYGGVSDMAVWRWVRDPDLKFPQPIKINQRNLWRLSDLIAFEARCAASNLKKGKAA